MRSIDPGAGLHHRLWANVRYDVHQLTRAIRAGLGSIRPSLGVQ